VKKELSAYLPMLAHYCLQITAKGSILICAIETMMPQNKRSFITDNDLQRFFQNYKIRKRLILFFSYSPAIEQ
jgi:hypothetical protein